MLNTEKLTPMQLARLNAALDKPYRFPDGIKTMRAFLASQQAIAKSTTDGMIDFNRRHFNRLDHKGQAAYEARLKAKRYYFANDIQIPKILYDTLD